MNLLDSTSLVNTVEKVNEAFLFERAVPSAEKLTTARWIASRQGEKGAYRASFAPTPRDFEQGIHLFTGEKLAYASARHILGEEAARAAWLLGAQDAEVKAAYQRATHWMRQVDQFNQAGTFCCGRCTLAFWRHFWVGDFKNKELQLVKGLQALKGQRLGNGEWRRYPFYYAIYTLLEIELEPAMAELRYAAPTMERRLEMNRSGAFHARRQVILEKALAKIA